MGNNQELLMELIRQEETLQFPVFTNETALQLGLLMVERAKEKKHAIVIDIVKNGQKLFYHALEGTSPDNEYWVAGKARAVNRFGRSSYYVGLYWRGRGVAIDPAWPIGSDGYAPYSGSFPIIVKNAGFIGTVTVSGLTDTDDADHKFVVDCIKEFLAK